MNLMSYEIISFFFVFRLTLVSPLDDESEQSYRLTIQVGDLGENSLARFVTIDISISDQDSGLNGEMSYRIEQGHEIIVIKILDQRSFLLVINHLIDREDKN